MIDGKKIIAVGGGKGGVGKSVVACNLAVGLAQRGTDVVLVDADLGAPNLHTLLGIERPHGSLNDLLGDRSRHLADVLTPTSIPGLRLACGAAPILGVANPEFQKKQRIIRELNRLDAEVLVVDIGAGVSYNVIDFFNAADIRLVVVTPQITSMHNAYGFIKSALHRMLQRAIAGRVGYREIFTGGGWTEEKMDVLLERVANFDPRYLSVFEPLIDSFSVTLMGNLLGSRRETNILWAMQRMVQDFLLVDCQVLGGLDRSPLVLRSVNRRRPFMLESPLDANGKRIEQAVDYLQQVDVQAQRQSATVALESARYLPKEERRGRGGKPAATALAEEVFTEEITDRRRADPRYPQNFPTEVRIEGVTHPARLVDISRSGARLSSIPEMPPDATIEIRLNVSQTPSLTTEWAWVTATVRYFDRHRQAAGCQFDNPEAARNALDAAASEMRRGITPLPVRRTGSAVGGV